MCEIQGNNVLFLIFYCQVLVMVSMYLYSKYDSKSVSLSRSINPVINVEVQCTNPMNSLHYFTPNACDISQDKDGKDNDQRAPLLKPQVQ